METKFGFDEPLDRWGDGVDYGEGITAAYCDTALSCVMLFSGRDGNREARSLYPQNLTRGCRKNSPVCRDTPRAICAALSYAICRFFDRLIDRT